MNDELTTEEAERLYGHPEVGALYVWSSHEWVGYADPSMILVPVIEVRAITGGWVECWLVNAPGYPDGSRIVRPHRVLWGHMERAGGVTKIGYVHKTWAGELAKES